MNLQNIEFSDTPQGDVEVRLLEQPPSIYEQKHTDLTNMMIEYIREFYPEAFNSLSKEYNRYSGNRFNYRYRIVHRFIRCNFGSYDSKLDINNQGNFSFEEVKCPMKGECKYWNIICNPKFNSNLTDRELEVMKLLYESLKVSEIADMLSISIKTVETHKQNSLRKLNLHSLVEFMSYANKKQLFWNNNE